MLVKVQDLRRRETYSSNDTTHEARPEDSPGGVDRRVLGLLSDMSTRIESSEYVGSR